MTIILTRLSKNVGFPWTLRFFSVASSSTKILRPQSYLDAGIDPNYVSQLQHHTSERVTLMPLERAYVQLLWKVQKLQSPAKISVAYLTKTTRNGKRHWKPLWISIRPFQVNLESPKRRTDKKWHFLLKIKNGLFSQTTRQHSSNPSELETQKEVVKIKQPLKQLWALLTTPRMVGSKNWLEKSGKNRHFKELIIFRVFGQKQFF